MRKPEPELPGVVVAVRAGVTGVVQRVRLSHSVSWAESHNWQLGAGGEQQTSVVTAAPQWAEVQTWAGSSRAALLSHPALRPPLHTPHMSY